MLNFKLIISFSISNEQTAQLRRTVGVASQCTFKADTLKTCEEMNLPPTDGSTKNRTIGWHSSSETRAYEAYCLEWAEPRSATGRQTNWASIAESVVEGWTSPAEFADFPVFQIKNLGIALGRVHWNSSYELRHRPAEVHSAFPILSQKSRSLKRLKTWTNRKQTKRLPRNSL